MRVYGGYGDMGRRYGAFGHEGEGGAGEGGLLARQPQQRERPVQEHPRVVRLRGGRGGRPGGVWGDGVRRCGMVASGGGTFTHEFSWCIHIWSGYTARGHSHPLSMSLKGRVLTDRGKGGRRTGVREGSWTPATTRVTRQASRGAGGTAPGGNQGSTMHGQGGETQTPIFFVASEERLFLEGMVKSFHPP